MGVIDVIKKHQRLQGREEGREEGAEEKGYKIISNMIQNTKFNDARIASLTGTSIKRVQEIRAELGGKTRKN